jgi:WD40 repeat protein
VVFSDYGLTFSWTARAAGPETRMHAANGRTGQFSPDGSLVAVGSDLGVVQLLDSRTGLDHPTGPSEVFGPTPVAFGPDGDRVLLEGWSRWIDSPTGGEGVPRLIDPGVAAEDRGNVFAAPQRAALSPDRTVVVRFTAVNPDDREYILEVLDAATRARRISIPLAGLALWPAFAPDGKTVYAVVNRYVYGWDVATGQQVMGTAEPAGELVSRITVSPDGRYLGSAVKLLTHTQQRGIRVWDAASGKSLITAEAAHGRPHIAFSPDGRRFAAVVAPDRATLQGGDPMQYPGDIRVWDLESRTVAAAFSRFGGQMAFSPDGRTLAVTREHDVALLEVATGQVRHTFPHTGWVEAALAWRADGRVLAAASPEAPVYLWDVAGDRTGSVTAWASDRADRLWTALAGTDAVQAFDAARQLWGHPKEAADFLRGRVPADADARLAARACEALELPGTAEGKAVLSHWATGRPDAPRTREAKESLRRLAAAGDRGRG